MAFLKAGSKRENRAIFLDRDGVINRWPGQGFVTRWDQFRFLPGVLDALLLLKDRGEIVIVVSNQSVVGRGIILSSQLRSITREMLRAVKSAEGKIHAVYYCTHHPQENCSCRKPRIQMIQKAQRKFSIDLKQSFVIGDDRKDIQMGHRAGCRTILVLSGKQSRQAAHKWPLRPDRIEKDLLHAVRWILRSRSRSGA